MEMWKLLVHKLVQPWTSRQFWKQRGASQNGGPSVLLVILMP